MSTTVPNSAAGDLRERERLTVEQLHGIEAKIKRLQEARLNRITGLNKIRTAIAQTILGLPAVPNHHEHR